MDNEFDTLFENQYVRDEALVKDLNRYLFFRQPIQIVLYVLTGLLLAVTVIHIILVGWENAVLPIVFVTVFFSIKCITYHRAVKMQLARDREVNGAPVEIRECVTEESIQSATTRETAPIVLTYDQIRSVRQTKNLILILTKARLVHVFVKDRFTKGTPEGFLAFLKQKGVRV